METDQELVGKECHVTGAIDPASMGEIMVPVRGGWETYYAYATDPDESIAKGTRVLIIEQRAPRTVIVSKY
ncbi:MAG TPA: hypothetical protein VGM80_03350 [Gaiellaceae bacterium]